MSTNTPWIPVVRTVKDVEDSVSASTINPILKNYTDRTQHLYEKFQGIENKSVLIAFDQLVIDNSAAQYSVVYFDYEPVTPGLKRTSPAFSTSTYASTFKAANSAFIFGIIKTEVPSTSPKLVDVYIGGLIQATGIVTSLLDSSPDNTSFKGGPLFLSAFEPGKLTSVPGGFAIFVGYAKSLDEFYLAPSFEAFNEFFYNFKYKLLDRPIGTPVYNGTIWTVPTPDLTKVGWMSADDSSLTSPDLRPTGNQSGALFYYNIPSDANIDNNSELTAQEKADAKSLRRSLPPNPIVFSVFDVNGVIQGQKDSVADSTGVYYINTFGIWWYSNAAHSQPWSDDLLISNGFLPSQVNYSTDTITITNHGFTTNDILEFITINGDGSILPGNISGGTYSNGVISGGGTTYRVRTPTTDTFKLENPSSPGTTLDISDVGTGGPFYIKWQPKMWAYAKGSEFLRPRMTLQFTKINPDIKNALVTSLKPFNTTDNDSTKAIKFVDYAGIEKSVGDLFLRFKLPISTSVESPVTNTAIKSISYNEPNGTLITQTSNVITSVEGNGLVSASTDANGKCTLTVDNTSLANLVTSMEVEQGRLEYLGLHSFVVLPNNLLPCGFVGKFILPSKIPNLPLQFQMLLFGKSSISELSASTKVRLKFKFEYVVTKPGALLTSALTESKTFEYSFATTYVKNNCLLAVPVDFVIPQTNLVTNGIVNFRLHRIKYSGSDTPSNYYDGDLSIVGTYWTFGTAS